MIISGNIISVFVTSAVFLVVLLLTAVILVTLSPQSEAQTNNNINSSSNSSTAPTYLSVFSTDSKPYNLTYGEWTARWWQWAYSIPKNINPSYDDTGKYCSVGQSGPVWFLTSTYKHAVNRYCNVPAGKAILFTILNSECSYAEFPNLKTEQQLRQCAKEMQDSVTNVEASVDGISIKDLDKYRIQSPLFSFTLPKSNILGLPAHITTQSVSDGNWVFLKPFSVGKHIIYFKGSLRNITNNTHIANNSNINPSNSNFAFAGPYGWDYPTIYHLTVTNSSSSPSPPLPSSNQTLSNKRVELRLLADSLENRLNNSAAILEITGNLSQVKSVYYANSINPKLHGIPKDLDMPKRDVAQAILSRDKDFRVIFFLMPNGDIYLDEPYSLQTNLTKNNFAYRDYYKGAINTHDVYLGNIVISNSTGLPTPFMSVPIYSSENNHKNSSSTLVGIWTGGLNLSVLSKSLQSLNVTDKNNNNERIVYVDQYGQKLADSNKVSANHYNESFANLQSFKNAVAGKSGYIMEVVNGSKFIVFYHPVKFHSTTWAVLLMQRVV